MLELLAEEVGATEAVSISTDTANALIPRLKLLRAAWNGQPEPLDLSRLAALAHGLPRRRVALDFSDLPETTVLPAAMCRLVLNLLLLAPESLPQGGVLRLDGGANDVIARLVGPNAAWPARLIGMLADEATAQQALDNARTVLPPLTALLARHYGLSLTSPLPSGPIPLSPPLRLTTA